MATFNSLETYNKYKEDKKILKEIEKSKENFLKRKEYLSKERDKQIAKQQSLIEEKMRRRLQREESKINQRFEKKLRKLQWKRPLKDRNQESKKISKLKKELFTKIQLLARLEDTYPTGYWNCISCWKKLHWSEGDGWHYISRVHMSTAFDLRNIHLQCKYCNWQLHWNVIEYRRNLVEKYWEAMVLDLERRKHETKHFTIQELEDLLTSTNRLIEIYKKSMTLDLH